MNEFSYMKPMRRLNSAGEELSCIKPKWRLNSVGSLLIRLIVML